MAILLEQNASELRRIIKESIGRDISLEETHEVWRYVIKILELVWNIKRKPRPAPPPRQLGLFD